MDIGRTIRLTRLALETDKNAAVSKSALELRQRLDELSNQPADASIQTNTSQALSKLKQAIDAALESLSPEEVDQIAEVAGEALFSARLAFDVEQELRENPATPATSRDKLVQLTADRDTAFTQLRQFIATAEALGWDEEDFSSWEAEVGFKIPRSLFDNRFDGLLGELRYLRRFLSHISEAHGHSVEDIQLSGLSTTDPIIVLGVAIYLARELGGLTKWALDQWKTVEEIRKLRTETAKLASFNEDEIETFFGDKIRNQIKLGIDEEVARQVANVKPVSRKNELKNALSIDLKEFLGRIERGLTVEVRLIEDTSAVEIEEGEGEAEGGSSSANEIRAIAAELKFPAPSENPVLQITNLGPDQKTVAGTPVA